MKKNCQKASDRPHRLGAQQLASVRGGGIQGSGLAADNGVIHMQKADGAIHMQ